MWRGSVSRLSYHVEVSNRSAAFEDLDAESETNSVQEMIRENITNFSQRK
jgi:hypothetical protein